MAPLAVAVTPRHALGSERGSSAFPAGAMADGWEALALTALSRAAWTDLPAQVARVRAQ